MDTIQSSLPSSGFRVLSVRATLITEVEILALEKDIVEVPLGAAPAFVVLTLGIGKARNWHYFWAGRVLISCSQRVASLSRGGWLSSGLHDVCTGGPGSSPDSSATHTV